MKKYLIGGMIATLLVIVVLGVVNYFTCFAYSLPHRPAIIEIAPQDTVVKVQPEVIFIPKSFNTTAISYLPAR